MKPVLCCGQQVAAAAHHVQLIAHNLLQQQQQLLVVQTAAEAAPWWHHQIPFVVLCQTRLDVCCARQSAPHAAEVLQRTLGHLPGKEGSKGGTGAEQHTLSPSRAGRNVQGDA